MRRATDMAATRTYPAEAIVLHQTKLKETDLILTLLSSDGSQIRAVAKGARKGGGRLAARVGLFCECSLLLAKGRNLDVVTEAQLKDAHVALRSNPEMMFAASRVAELASLVSLEEVTDPFVFAITQRALGALGESPDEAHLNLIVAAYVFKLLAHSGWRPELSSCLSCSDENPSFFSSEAGGLLCSSCATDTAGAYELTKNDIAWLRALLMRTFDQLIGDPTDSATASRLLACAQDWVEAQLDVKLRSFDTGFVF